MITCQFENGDKSCLRHTVADALVISEGKILLVKRAAYHLEGGKYALPGGYVDRDETIKDAVQREVREETGYNSEVVAFFRIIDNPERRGEDRQNIGFIYIVKPTEKIAESDDEVQETKWFDLDNVPTSSEIAFDHLETIELYKQHLKKPFVLPLF